MAKIFFSFPSGYLLNRFVIQRRADLPQTLRILDPNFDRDLAREYLSHTRHLNDTSLQNDNDLSDEFSPGGSEASSEADFSFDSESTDETDNDASSSSAGFFSDVDEEDGDNEDE